MKISLILATIGRDEELRRLIRSLAQQTDDNFELIVVDQNPEGRLAGVLEEARGVGLDFHYLRLEVPSLSGARNLGLTHATGELVAFPDDDCWYERDVIKSVRSAFLSSKELDGLVARWVEQSAARPQHLQHGALSLRDWRNFRGGDASSICLFFNTCFLRHLGGFDVRFGVGCWFGAGEETDVVMTALESGGRLVRCYEACVHHHYSAFPSRSLRAACRIGRSRGRGTGAIYAKHHLGWWVIFRGLVSPVILPLISGRVRDALRGVCVAWGRLEGFLRWNFGGDRC